MVVPNGAGKRDGKSWSSAASLADLPKLVKQRATGGEVWLRSDLGSYTVKSPITLTSGGAPGKPVVIRGVDGAGKRAAAVITGTRTAPYSAKGSSGGEVFRLLGGANHLRFADLDARNHGNGVFRIAGPIKDLTVEDVKATNVQRFLEDYTSSGQKAASADGLVLRRVTVRGFSRSVARLQYDTRNVLLEDVVGDSERQDGDDFAMGVHLDDTVHAVVLRRVRMDNSTSRRGGYWNGDGFASERGVYDVRFEDTSASGSTDGGYDLKSTRTTLVRATASNNKRNFRFWANDTVVTDCRGTSPVKQGGSGAQAQVQLSPGAKVTMTGCTFTDGSAGSIVFELQSASTLNVVGGSVQRSAKSRLSMIEKGSKLTVASSTVQRTS